MMPTTDSAMMIPKPSCAAAGKSGRAKRRKPYAPILRSTPARSTDPPVGASVCASGSQVCSGNIGILIMNARANAENSQNCSRGVNMTPYNVTMSNVSAPSGPRPRSTTYSMATNMNALPTIV